MHRHQQGLRTFPRNASLIYHLSAKIIFDEQINIHQGGSWTSKWDWSATLHIFIDSTAWRRVDRRHWLLLIAYINRALGWGDLRAPALQNMQTGSHSRTILPIYPKEDLICGHQNTDRWLQQHRTHSSWGLFSFPYLFKVQKKKKSWNKTINTPGR